MIDTVTMKRIEVVVGVTTKPYVVVEITQLEAVCTILTTNNIPHEVRSDAVCIDGHPASASIGIPSDYADAAQDALDAEV
jgi:hypothetical protein